MLYFVHLFSPICFCSLLNLDHLRSILLQIAALQRTMVSNNMHRRKFFLPLLYPVLHISRETGSVEWVSLSCTTCGKKIVGTGGIVSGILNVSGKTEFCEH